MEPKIWRKIFSRKNIIAACLEIILLVGGEIVGHVTPYLKIAAWLVAILVLIYFYVPFRKWLEALSTKQYKPLIANKKVLSVLPICIMAIIAVLLFVIAFRPLVNLITPSTFQTPDFKDDARIVYLETAGLTWYFTVSELKNGTIKPCDFNEVIPLQIYVDNNEWYINVSLYNTKGSPSARIEKNKFVMKPPNWDMNFNGGAFEVGNDKQEPVFQLIFKSPNKAIINGFFPMGNDAFITSEFGIANPDRLSEVKFERLFKYPSNKYPGQLK